MPPPPQPSGPPRAQHPHSLNPPSFPSSRSSTASPSRGSVTQTQTLTQTNAATGPSQTIATSTLRLRGAHDPNESRRQRRRGPAIRWAEDVVDNERMGRKSSKVCCIYHRPRAVGESSSEDDSSSSSDDSSDAVGESSGADDGAARPVGGASGKGAKRRRRQHHHHHGHDHDHGKDGAGEGSAKRRGRRPSPNAYERMPKTSTGPKGSKGGRAV